MRLFLFGAGFSSRAIAAALAGNAAWTGGTTRSSEKMNELEELSIAPYRFDGETISSKLRSALRETTHLVQSIAPPRDVDSSQPDAIADPVLAAFSGEALKTIMPALQWAGYLSTVGVYGNHDGAWVNEETEVRPVSARSRQRVAAEAEWMAACDHAGIPLGVFRLSGIYGPGRNAFNTIEKGKSRRLVKPGQVFNRIHVEDIGQAAALAARRKAEGIFNITDDEPAPPQDVVTFAHQLMGREPPPEIDFETADLSPMARSFYGENKRVSNEKSKLVLGMDYEYPDYRTALTRMWEEGSWR